MCCSICFALVHPLIILSLLLSYQCVSSCWHHSAKLFLSLVLPEDSSAVPVCLHWCFPGILPAIWKITSFLCNPLFFALELATNVLYIKPQFNNSIATICPSSGLHFQVFSLSRTTAYTFTSIWAPQIFQLTSMGAWQTCRNSGLVTNNLEDDIFY